MNERNERTRGRSSHFTEKMVLTWRYFMR